MSSFITAIATVLNIPIQDFASSVQGNNDLRQLLPDFTRQIENCYTSQGFTDPQLGTFEAEYSLSCLQPSRCPPQKPQEIRPKFLLFLRTFPNQVFEITNQDVWVRGSLRGQVTVFVDGYFSDYKSNKRGNQTVYGYLKSHHFDTDVILLDYFHGDVYRDQAVANTRVLGALIGQLVSDLGIVSKTICSGFSIGAHACGFAGQWLQEHRNVVLPTCIVIDPSGPGYEGCPDKLKLSIGDCGVISVLHGSYFPIQGLIYGTREKSGNCDFYVNFGKREPGCPRIDTSDFVNSLARISFDDFVSGVEILVACDHLTTQDLFNRLLMTGTRLLATKCSLGESVDPSNGRNTRVLPPFNRCNSKDDSSYCLDIDRLP